MTENGIGGTYEHMGQKYPLTLKKTVKTKPGNTALSSSETELAKLAAKQIGGVMNFPATLVNVHAKV